MSQTNIQVPIEQRNSDQAVLKNRSVAKGGERATAPGPVLMGSDPRPGALLLMHGRREEAAPVPDLTYGDNRSIGSKSVMAGRRHSDMGGGDLTHLAMPVQTHNPSNTGSTPVEGGIALPKDQ